MPVSCESRLRKRTSAFLRSRAPSGLKVVRRELANSRCVGYLFGGVLRDLSLPSGLGRFRDIDVVVTGADLEKLRIVFGKYLRRETRFGGLNLFIEDCFVDIWPLETTWAFQQNLLPPLIENLARSTFLTIEGVVYELVENSHQIPRVFSEPFCRALTTQTLDLNFAPTPYPGLNAIRTLMVALRSGFSLTDRLSRFVHSELSLLAPGMWTSLQRAHYGRELLSAQVLRERLAEIERALSQDPCKSVRLHLDSELQMELWTRWADASDSEIGLVKSSNRANA